MSADPRARRAAQPHDRGDSESSASEPTSGRPQRRTTGFTSLFARARAQTGRMRKFRKSPVFQHATAARERGNLEASFWLLLEEFEQNRDAPDVSLALWDVACELGRPRQAVDAAQNLIQRHAANGDFGLAAVCWTELVRAVPDALVAPATLAGILVELQKPQSSDDDEDPSRHRELVCTALRHAVDPRNEPLTAGLALRIFEAARDVHPEAARSAARAALAFESLHATKRKRLVAWLEGGAQPTQETPPPPSAAPAGASVPEPEPTPAAGPEPASEPESRATASVRTGIRIVNAVPCELTDAGLEVRARSGQRTCVSFQHIEAIAVAEVGHGDGSAEGFVIVDLLLNWVRRGEKPLQCVRLRSDSFRVEASDGASHVAGSLAQLLTDLMQRAQAIPLPDPESALGLRLSRYPSIERYEEEVLMRPR